MNSTITNSFRDGSLIRDRAILDLLQLQELGLVPGSVRAQRLQALWGVTQPQVSRRMAEVDRLGLVAVRSGGRRYRLFTADDIRAQRWETVRRRLQDLAHHKQLTKDGLAAAKARGVKLGGIRPNTIKENARAKEQAAKRSEQLRPVLTAMTAQGASLREMAAALASAGTTTAKGLPLSASGVKNHLLRLGLLKATA